jgi:hypothetical protein
MSAGAQGLFDLNATAGEFTEIMGSFRDLWATGPTNETAASTSTPAFMTSPQRRTNAIKLAQKEEWLAPAERVALIRILRDVTKADVYIALDTDDVRIPWIIDELNDVGVMVFHPVYSSLTF